MQPVSGSRLIVDRTWDGRPIGADEGATVDLCLAGADLLARVDAPFHDDPAPRGPAGSTERLWEHEVVEFFLVGADLTYLEVELGPRGHYLVLRLEGRRNVVASGLALDYEATIAGSRFSGRARLPAAGLPARIERANAFAIHGQGAGRRFLAAHPVGGTEPDFHRIESFPAFRLAECAEPFRVSR